MRAGSLTKNWPKVLALVVFCVGLAWALYQPPAQAKQTVNHAELFRQKVRPIFEQNCNFCHGGAVQRSGLDLRSEDAILRGGARGAGVVPGMPAKSLLYKLITHAEEPAMPMGGGKLSAEEVAVVAQWIEALPADLAKASGAGEGVTPVRSPGYKITDKDRQFWAFQKPVRAAVPQVKNQAWVRNEVDAFVLSRLEANGLKPAPAASPRELIRRVYLDLTGLPPTPEEVEAFAAKPTEQAYDAMVEKLLASPAYGERWGRHWLDLARYADSGGYEFDVDRPHAWRYRDYVIKSFNADKPYDRFIKEQLAGDQINPQDNELLIATAFCRNGPTVDNVADENEQARSDELDDMVATTSSVFMGLTMGCARCHDHKYDPLPTKDYYRMQAIFFPYKKTERLLVGPSEAEAHKARNKELNEQAKPFKDQIAAIEKPIRDQLLKEKVEFHVRLGEQTGTVTDANREEFRRETAARFAKDVKLQPEEITERLTPDALEKRKVLQAEVDKIDKLRPKPLPAVMGVTDKPDPGKAHLLLRGSVESKGEEVQPGLPVVLAGEGDLRPANPRLQLAEWIANPNHPLTARVAVNRIWQYHFGKGIVRTPSDFGTTGDKPTHPELLDWLAVEFMNRGWSWKAMHRLMLKSNAYRQSSRYDANCAQKDPENKLLWRANPHRVESEVLRDSILAISGKLNREMFGPGVFPPIDAAIINTGSRPRWPLDAKEGPEVWRRSVYVYVKRSVLVPLLEVFDCPVTVVTAPVRSASTVAPQALALMNNEFVLEQAGYFAERIAKESGANTPAQIKRAFNLALMREPSAKELDWATKFLATQTRGYAARKHEQPEAAALRDFCHAIFNLNEFLYVD